MLNNIILIAFYLLFAITPLVWTPVNFELFEFNKMFFVYVLTVVVASTWTIRMISSRQLLIKRTPLDIPLLIFLVANIASTLFSIDRHISVFGYYSRLNGGLLSTIAYIILYFALVSNVPAKHVPRLLLSGVLGGLAVALWAIPEHFGRSLSCVVMYTPSSLEKWWRFASQNPGSFLEALPYLGNTFVSNFHSDCWRQNVQDRVFATLGQPNWLGAYMAMVIFPAIYFLANTQSIIKKWFLFAITLALYTALTFTYSRGSTLGLLAGVMVFFGLLVIVNFHSPINKSAKAVISSWWRPTVAVIAGFITITLLFGSPFNSFRLITKDAPPPRPSITAPSSGSTQLETEGDQTGKIRMIVWQGALEIFKSNPILGTGVETFAYSYYNYRPQAHNLTSEWDFLYNKAHNEYLNYLATTGFLGFASYILVILTFSIWSIKKILSLRAEHKNTNFSLILFLSLLLASYVSYLAQNFFSFSVVILALFFYLFPGLAFLADGKLTDFKPSLSLSYLGRLIFGPHPGSFRSKLAIGLVVFLSFNLLSTLVNFWQADRLFTEASRSQGTVEEALVAHDKFAEAIKLNPGEPFYRGEYAYLSAEMASVFSFQEATKSAEYKKEAADQTLELLQQHPYNTSVLRTALRTYLMLSTVDGAYANRVLETLDISIVLAPTDPKLTYNKGLFLFQLGYYEESIDNLYKTISLKPNYKDAYFTLGEVYMKQGDKAKAIDQIKEVLKFSPNDPEAQEKLAEWEKAPVGDDRIKKTTQPANQP